MVNHIVVTRPGYELIGPAELSDRIIDLRSNGKQVVTDDQGRKIYLTDVVMKDVSATQVRSLASKGLYDELVTLLSPPVVKYIEKYGVYQESNED
jgi:nicotinic acid mononucleotide adenylyltransferase